MTIRVVALSLYGLVGAVVLLSGMGVALTPLGLLPENLAQAVIEFADSDPLSMHLTQELGAALVFMGLTTFWFVRHYEQSLSFHWALTAFLGLFWLAHAVDLRGTWHLGLDRAGGLVVFLIFVIVGVLRRGETHGQFKTRK